jgi:ribonuclease P protein component
MLPKKNRFSRSSFPRSGPQKRVAFLWGSVTLYPSDSFKAAVVVSKKTLPHAVDRNRVTRRAYAALARLSPAPRIGVVIFLRREALQAPFGLIMKDLARALE